MQFVASSKFILNRKGLTIVELLLASAASIVVLLATGEFMLAQMRQTRSIQQSVEARSLQQDVVLLYSHGGNCTGAFLNQNGNVAAPLPSLVDAAGQVHYAVGQRYGDGGILQLVQIDMVPVPPPSLPEKRGQFLIRMTMARTGSTSAAGNVIVDVPIFFEANPANLIKSCTSVRQSLQTAVECVTVTRSIVGQAVSVACPTGYDLTGGGMRDSDICKCAIRDGPIRPGTPGYPTGGWVCQEEETSGLTCYARCCRPAP